jgi:hypothetical protein
MPIIDFDKIYLYNLQELDIRVLNNIKMHNQIYDFINKLNNLKKNKFKFISLCMS